MSFGESAFCSERACPALGCAAAPNPGTAVFLRDWGGFIGAASQPSAGQARSPQKAHRSHNAHPRGSAVCGESTCCSESTSCAESAFCSERACPALGCAAAPKPGTAVFLRNCGGLIGAASQPSAGQARSPQKAHRSHNAHPRGSAVCGESTCCGGSALCAESAFCSESTSCVESAFCSERACPALGCAAAPKPGTAVFLRIAVALLGPLRSPARGKPAHHKRPIGHITPIRVEVLSVVKVLAMEEVLYVLKVLSVVSGLAPRWAAQQPQNQALRFFCEIAVALLGPLRSPARGKPAHHERLIGHLTSICGAHRAPQLERNRSICAPSNGSVR